MKHSELVLKNYSQRIKKLKEEFNKEDALIGIAKKGRKGIIGIDWIIK
ncbi:hypothetical protein X924_02080 [Petrotoga sp. 9PWA.NaAc.5.4]|nr:hypothetical protein X924_02080 [Petrotoga sp. 9PWA.NaAc.5.4]